MDTKYIKGMINNPDLQPNATVMIPLFLSFSYTVRLLILSLLVRTIPPEHLPPKHSFPSTCCAWFRYPVPTYLPWTSLLFPVLPQCSLTSSIAQPSLPVISVLAKVL